MLISDKESHFNEDCCHSNFHSLYYCYDGTSLYLKVTCFEQSNPGRIVLLV